MEEIACLRCGGETEPGFVLDHGHYELIRVAEWGAGEPKNSFWTGIKKPQRRLSVTTHRCTTCGFLMEFAQPSDSE